MRKRYEVCAVACALIAMLSACADGFSPAGSIDAGRLGESRLAFPKVLMYHEITTSPKDSSDVSIANFQAQMDWLKNNGYTTVSLSAVYNYMVNGGSLPSKAVLITFDDGYVGNCLNAVPILKNRNMQAAFFVHTDYVGKPGAHDHMTWEQLKSLDASPLFEVQSHTKTHPHLTQVSSSSLAAELSSSKSALQTQLGGMRDVLAYPFGDYNAAVIDAARQHYKMAFVVANKGTFGRPVQYSIPRIGVGKSVTTLAQFSALMR